MKCETKVIKCNEYFQLEKKPSAEELKNYYENMYYQQNKGNYESEYSPSELKYFENTNKMIKKCISRLGFENLEKKTFLDLGTGDGWALDYFHKEGCVVTGVDYSDYGIKTHNKSVIEYFTKSEINEYVYSVKESGIKFDIINLTNIIEHILNPEDLILELKEILASNGILIITFPNDFSNIQKILLENSMVECEYWVAYPGHISYFNGKSFKLMVERLGLNMNFYIADFPIDIFLLNEHSNYITDKTKEKAAHLARQKIMEMLLLESVSKSVDLMVSFGEAGLGRNLTAFITR